MKYFMNVYNNKTCWNLAYNIIKETLKLYHYIDVFDTINK